MLTNTKPPATANHQGLNETDWLHAKRNASGLATATPPARPAILPLDADGIPDELREIRAWIGWRLEQKDGRWTKVPIDIQTGGLAKTNDPACWCDFYAAVENYKIHGCDGLGLCRTGDLVFVDLDGVVAPDETIKPFPWCRQIMSALAGRGYFEESVTGTGIHVITRGSLPAGRRQFDVPGLDHTGVGLYDGSRYFTVSGAGLMRSGPIQESSVELGMLHSKLHAEWFRQRQTGNGNGHHTPRPLGLGDSELINHARRAENGTKFIRLFDHGDWSKDYPGKTQSEADLGLCCLLAFWTNKDAGRIDRLFRQSALYRDKWERDDYRADTIAKAINGTHNTYDPDYGQSSSTAIDPEPRSAAGKNRATGQETHQAGGEAADEWPKPQPIHSELPPVDDFSEDLLPDSFRPLVADVTERMQVPMDYPAVAMVLCLAGAVNRRAVIQPKAKDTGWVIVPNLWGGIIAPPGFMKSPVIQAATRPLNQVQTEWRRDHEEALKDYAAEKEKYELRCAAWRDRYKEASKKGNAEPARPEDQLAEPKLRRLIVNDSTFEALHETMSENPAGILVIRDELTGWWSQLDKAGREGERAFCLQAWNGDTGHTIDRIGRGTIHVEACCMSMLGGIQPGRLRSYLVDALKDGPGNDGLLQRFQLLVWPDTAREWNYVDREPDGASEEMAVRVFRKLVDMDAENQARFRFASNAQGLFTEWLAELEAKIRGDELHPAVISHLSKYRRLMPSLALLFHLAEAGGAGVDTVSLHHAQQAAEWCNYLESHARRVYSCITTPQMRAARELADKIKRRKVGTNGYFSCRDVYRNEWSGLNSPESVKQAAEVLQDAGWVRAGDSESSDLLGRGRPAIRYEINPGVWQ